MKNTTVIASCLAALGGTALLHASPAGAENDAYEMAVRQSEAGFTIFPGSSGSMQAGEKIRLLMPVTKGVTYCFLVGVDERVGDVDLYVNDEQGNELLADDRRDRRAGAKFRATYTGTAEVYVFLGATKFNKDTAKYHGIASWALLVGTRGGSAQQKIEPVDPASGGGSDKARDATPKGAGEGA